MLFSFVLNKASGYKVFCEPETIQNKQTIKSVLKNIFCFEDYDHEEVHFSGETLTFTLQLIKI